MKQKLKSGASWELPRGISYGTEVYADPGDKKYLPVSKGYPKVSSLNFHIFINNHTFPFHIYISVY